MTVISRHNKTSYGSCFNSTIGGRFFLLSVFTGLVQTALLEEYFLLKNQVKDDPTAKVKIFFGTAYNKFGEDKPWKQERVRQFFAEEELLIGKAYWNFVCNDDMGFEIVFDQYRRSADKIRTALTTIKGIYFR